ncbi:MAG: D-alanyl-D-alanine carboxypeptidase [Arenicella sp.]|nr:D-alanyl-D-alanine carboxypeptidase [Arenicella sp.]
MKCSKFSFRPSQPPKDVISVAGRLIGAFMLFSFVTITTHAQQSSHASNSDFALSVKSTGWALMEARSGWVVANSNGNQPLPPASITKLMMNYAVFSELAKGSISLNDEVAISEKAWRSEGSRMFADVNTTINLEHLLKSTIIQSGNDAAIALAEHTSGSEERFAALMNDYAQQLGLTHSRFKNASGLPAPGHHMSAVDILKLSAAIIDQFGEYYSWYGIKEYEHNSIRQFNRNKLLWRNLGVDGLKTGHTEAAGYCLVSSAQRQGQRWIAVVMGTESEALREQAVTELLEYGFDAFDAGEVLSGQGGVAQARVYGGETDQVLLKPISPVYVAVPRGRLADIEVRLKMAPSFDAPIQLKQSMGVAALYLDGNPLLDVPLVAMSEIPEGGFLKRVTDTISRSIGGLFD